ncbi:MAG: HNH endonuclease [Bryobacteraceae bacterium]
MNERLEQIRRLLNELEDQIGTETGSLGDRDFSALELPLIIQEIVDDLQPLLSPYQAAFYWYLFRHSLAENGNPLSRFSTRGLQTGVVKSNRSDTISLRHVRETMAALETFGAIRREGEPNRGGTPYRVLIPDEIEACRKFRAERTATQPRPEISAADIDYYNVRENRVKVFERDAYKCRYCDKQLTRFTATLDHVTPPGDGGDNSLGNLVTACLGCNSRKNKRPLGDFLAETDRP